MKEPRDDELRELLRDLDDSGLAAVRYRHEKLHEFGDPKHHWRAREVSRWIDAQTKSQHDQLVDLAVKSNTIAQEAKDWARRSAWIGIVGALIALAALYLR